MPFEIRWSIVPDREMVKVEFVSGGENKLNMEMSPPDVLELIHAFGTMHEQLTIGRAVPPLATSSIEVPVIGTEWLTGPAALGEAALISFYHTKFGPVGFLLSLDQIPQMIRGLGEQAARAKAERHALKN